MKINAQVLVYVEFWVIEKESTHVVHTNSSACWRSAGCSRRKEEVGLEWSPGGWVESRWEKQGERAFHSVGRKEPNILGMLSET